MKPEYQRIEELLERFFDGQTSNAQERELYDFFRSDTVPEHLSAYKLVMAYLESGLEREAAEKGPRKAGLAVSAGWLRWMAGTAAAVIVLCAGLLPFLLNAPASENYTEVIVIRDGVVIDDPQEIERELRSVMEIVEENERREQWLLGLIEKEPASVLPELRQGMEDFINEFPEGPLREEVRELIQKN